MMKKGKNMFCGESKGGGFGCLSVNSIVTVDERGQMVLPKEIREKAGIKAGDKLAVVSMEKGENVCCISLIKVDDFAEMVKGMLGPMMEEVFKGKK